MSVFTVILLGSSIPIFVGDGRSNAADMALPRRRLPSSFLMGAAFLANQVLDFRELHFGWATTPTARSST